MKPWVYLGGYFNASFWLTIKRVKFGAKVSNMFIDENALCVICQQLTLFRLRMG